MHGSVGTLLSAKSANEDDKRGHGCPASEVVLAEALGGCQSHRSQAGRAIRSYRTALTALRDLGARNLTRLRYSQFVTMSRTSQADCRAAPLASAIKSSTDHWSY